MPPPSPPPRRQLAASTNARCGQMVVKERSRIPREVRAPLPFPPPFFKTGSLGDPVPRAPILHVFSPSLPSFERRRQPLHRSPSDFLLHISLSLLVVEKKKKRKRERKESCFPISLTLLIINRFQLQFDDNFGIILGILERKRSDLWSKSSWRDRFSFPVEGRRRITQFPA